MEVEGVVMEVVQLVVPTTIMELRVEKEVVQKVMVVLWGLYGTTLFVLIAVVFMPSLLII